MNVHVCVPSEKRDSLSGVQSYECVSSTYCMSQGLILNQTDFELFFGSYEESLNMKIYDKNINYIFKIQSLYF